MAHIRQSRPDSGLSFHVKPLETCELVPGRGDACFWTGLCRGSECRESILGAALPINWFYDDTHFSKFYDMHFSKCITRVFLSF